MRIRRILPPAIAAAALSAALPFLRSLPDSTWFEGPEGEEAYVYARMCEEAKQKHGVEAFWTFDEPECVRARSNAVAAGVKSAKGRVGYGLGFDGGNSAVFWTDHLWHPGADGFTVAMWVKAKPLPASQDIFCTWADGHMGFRIHEGRMKFDYLKSEEGILAVGYDFKKYGQFVHVAAVADPRDRSVSIYEDGVLMDRADYPRFEFDLWNHIAFGKGSPMRSRYPFNGTIDEAAIWNRALGADEIAGLVSARVGLDVLLSTPKARARRARYHAKAVAMRFLGNLVLSGTLDFGRVARASRSASELDRVALSIPDSGWRRLARAHAGSKRAGCKSSGAGAKVEAFVTISGKTARCLVSLGGDTAAYPFGARIPYVVEPVPGEEALPGGCRRIGLYPPESSGWTIPLFAGEVRKAYGLSGAMSLGCGLASLSVNGLGRGCYLVRDLSREGVAADCQAAVLEYPGSRALVHQRIAEAAALAPDAPDPQTAALAALLSDDARASIRERLARAEDAIWNDGFSPVPRAAREKRLAAARARCDSAVAEAASAAAAPDAAAFDETLFLGANQSPWRIETDLDFDSFRRCIPAEWGVSFKSSDPAVMADDGSVTLPQGYPAFVNVAMTLSRADGASVERVLEYRVMPSDCEIPAMYVWTAVPVGRIHRTRCAVEVAWPPASRRAAEWHDASIRYRGNSSFLKKRKLLNIKTDTPHGLFGDSETRHLLGINAASDVLHAWNAFAMELFRSFPRDDGAVNHAPRVFLAELFVNGRYRGLKEFAERIDGCMFGREDISVFRHQVARPRIPMFRQTFPELDERDDIPAYLALEEFLAASHDAGGLGDFARKIDLTSVADLQILFSFLGNSNGFPNRFWFQETLVYDPVAGRFSQVPWDFDDSASLHSLGIVETDFTRFVLDRGFREFRRDRWNALRKGPLSEENLARLFDGMVERQRPLLPTDARDWRGEKALDAEGFERLVERSHAYLRSQLALLDGLYNNW